MNEELTAAVNKELQAGNINHGLRLGGESGYCVRATVQFNGKPLVITVGVSDAEAQQRKVIRP